MALPWLKHVKHAQNCWRTLLCALIHSKLFTGMTSCAMSEVFPAHTHDVLVHSNWCHSYFLRRIPIKKVAKFLQQNAAFVFNAAHLDGS